MSIDLILQNNDNLCPRDEIKIENVALAPYPDNRRIRVEIALTPFRERPNLEITILDAENKAVGGSSAVAVMNFRSSYVLHLRGMDDPTGSYTVRVQLYYETLDAVQDTRDTALTLPAETAESDQAET